MKPYKRPPSPKLLAHFKARHGEFIERFWRQVEKTDRCWNWTGWKTKAGYGMTYRDRRKVYCHRLSWEMANGAIPDGLEILHECDNPACLNPAHLRPGTHAENMADSGKRGRVFKGFGELGPNAKLTAPLVLEMRRRKAAGETVTSIVADLGVKRGTAVAAIYRSTWNHI